MGHKEIVPRRPGGSAPSLVMVLGFVSFLIADGTPGGLDGVQGFVIGATVGIMLSGLLLLPVVLRAISSPRSVTEDAPIAHERTASIARSHAPR